MKTTHIVPVEDRNMMQYLYLCAGWAKLTKTCQEHVQVIFQLKIYRKKTLQSHSHYCNAKQKPTSCICGHFVLVDTPATFSFSVDSAYTSITGELSHFILDIIFQSQEMSFPSHLNI